MGAAAQTTASESTTSPIVAADPQQWTDQADMTWDDYVPVRLEEWNSPTTSQGSERQFRAAVILIDYQDQPFLIAQEQGSHPFGNPAPEGSPWHGNWEPVEDVQGWFQEYFNEPNEFNGGQTIHSYWMETSHGRTGVDVDVFGPYTMPGKQHEWGLTHGPTGLRQAGNQAGSVCPAGDTCTGRNIRTDANLPWRTEMIANGLSCPLSGGVADCGFDFVLYVTAGHDESSTWQEWGEMTFRTHLDVPAALGPPGAENGPVLNNAGNPIPNYTSTRYFGDAGIPPEQGGFTSWRAAANQWPNATGGSRPSSTQAESSGQSTFAHEVSHLFGLPDNYNNPFADNARNWTGYWEMMSRGSFNGPGGTHNRWQVPNQGGSALGPHHMLHFKQCGTQRLCFLADDEHVEVNRADLANDGIAVVPLKAREYVPNGDQVGLTVHLGTGGFVPGACQAQVTDTWWCGTQSGWQRFTMEVVDRVGNDSFVAGHGVLLANARNTGTPRVQVVDANPRNINRIDFYRPGNATEPGGEPVPVLRGDPRQLDDATFHAGTLSDSQFEYVDGPNNLHFYVLDAYRNDEGALMYDVAVRNLTGAGAFERDASLGDPTSLPVGDSTAVLNVPLTNTGEAGQGIYGSDVYRISASIDGEGWDVHLPYEVVAADAGETVPVTVYATGGAGATESATVTLTATSESDPNVSVTLGVELTSTDLKVTVETASALVESYYANGVIGEDERNQLRSQLTVLRRTTGKAAQNAVNHFEAFAERIADVGARNLASAALVSVAEDLRSGL